MWNVDCLHLLSGRFLLYTGKRVHLFYKKRREMLMGHPDTLPFEVSTQIVQLRGTSNGREDLYSE